MSLIDPYMRRNMLLDQASGAHARGSEYSRGLYGLSYALADREQKERRLLTGFKGRGDYNFGLFNFTRGSTLNAAAAPGASAGGSFHGFGRYRRRLGRRRRGFRGRGEYAGDAGGNQIMPDVTAQAPITVNAGDDSSGDIFISHREFVANVQALVPSSGLSAFNVTSYPVNVGLSTTFPWLSQIAQNFSLYDLQGCIFEYKPTSGELGSASNQLGKVVMGTQYDPDIAAFASAVEMENYDYVTSCKPSQHMMHGCETALKQRATQMLYVRTGSSPKDKIFTDIGTFQIATEGVPVTGSAGTYQNIGELWVTYKVRLSRARLNASLGQTVLTDFFWASGATAANCFSTTQASLTSDSVLTVAYNNPPAAGYAAPNKYNNIGCQVQSTNNTSALLRFPANIFQGYFMVTWIAYDSAATATVGAAPSGATNCTVITLGGSGNSLPAASSYWKVPYETASLTARMKSQSFLVFVSAPGNNQASVTLNWSATVNTATSAHDIFVQQINSAVATSLPS